MAQQIVPKLRAIEVSPATLQYKPPRPQKLFYKRRFFPQQPIKDQLSQPWLWTIDPTMPKYPYSKDYKFDEANRGLYGGVTIRKGNKISDGRNEGKTKRKWYPNVRPENLESQLLGVRFTLPVVARVVRTIKKCGGLDQYLLGDKPARIKELGLMGWKLRWLVMQSQTYKDKVAEQRAALGFSDASNPDSFTKAWEDAQIREALIKTLSTEDTGAKWQLEVLEEADLDMPPEIIEEQSSITVPPVPRGYGVPDTAEVVTRRLDARLFPVTLAVVDAYNKARAAADSGNDEFETSFRMAKSNRNRKASVSH